MALALPVQGFAKENGFRDGLASALNGKTAFVSPGLLARAKADPNQQFNVIIQGDSWLNSKLVGDTVGKNNGRARRSFASIIGSSASIPGKWLVILSRIPHIVSITEDAPVQSADDGSSGSGSSGPGSGTTTVSTTGKASGMWPETTDVAPLWNNTDPNTGAVLGPAPKAPAIAIVDSGIDTSKPDFGNRIVASVNFSSLAPKATGDGQGHGTMVAAIAAGSNPKHPGVAQNAPIVNLRTSDNNGQSLTSDVIAATDWILANKDKYNIRVANFSMAGSGSTSFRFDPLDRAVEKLWFNGIVVVAAVGNYGTGAATDTSKAPGNDPFVITVGAVDQNESSDPFDDTVPAWSAYGYTMDGFSKPDMVAPGRYMVAAVPAAGTIPATVPGRVLDDGTMWMSGTSFAAPIVAGAAAQILARHPNWGPNEVKGALMLTSTYLDVADPQSVGVGEIDGAYAASLDFTPPNPNENFMPYVGRDAVTGQLAFNAANWASAVSSNASWSSANWASANWASASWSSANWASASWSSASWSSAGSQSLESQVNWSEGTFEE